MPLKNLRQKAFLLAVYSVNFIKIWESPVLQEAYVATTVRHLLEFGNITFFRIPNTVQGNFDFMKLFTLLETALCTALHIHI
jgi:hypothetical protein